MADTEPTLIPLDQLRREDVAQVGGKNSSLGEMLQSLGSAGIRVPSGFATTAETYRRFLRENGLGERIAPVLDDLAAGRRELADAGETIRALIRGAEWPDDIAADIRAAYRDMGEATGQVDASVAVRSSATAEDLPEASFAGQQETYLNVRGEDALLDACRRCFASLFTDRAITYRTIHGFDHLEVALSVGVQMMVRADQGGSGVMFSLDTETGFDKVVMIDAAWGLGRKRRAGRRGSR